MTNKLHDIYLGDYDDQIFCLTVDGSDYQIPWVDCSPKLAQANKTEREFIEISPSGYGLHWPLLDEDLAIEPLMRQAEVLEKELISA